MGRSICGLLLGLLVLGAPIAASDKLTPPPLDQYLRWGTLRVRPQVQLKNLGYDNNIYATNTSPVGDYTATVAPSLEGLFLLGNTSFLTYGGEVAYTAYANNADQNFTDYRFTGRLTVPVRTMGVFVDAAFVQANERPIDQQDIRPVRDDRGLLAGFIFEPGWRTEIEIARRLRRFDYVDPDFDFTSAGMTIGERLNRDEAGTTFAVSYRILGSTNLLLQGLTQKVDFDSAIVIGTEQIPRDTDERRLLTGLAFLRGGPLSGNFRIGYGTIDAEDPRLADFSGIIGDARLAYRLTSDTRIELEAESLPGFAVYEANAYYQNTEIGMRFVHYLNRLIGLEAGALTGELTFPDSQSEDTRKDQIQSYEIGLRFRMNQSSLSGKVEYSLRLQHYRRDSTLDYVDLTRTTLGVQAVVGF